MTRGAIEARLGLTEKTPFRSVESIRCVAKSRAEHARRRSRFRRSPRSVVLGPRPVPVLSWRRTRATREKRGGRVRQAAETPAARGFRRTRGTKKRRRERRAARMETRAQPKPQPQPCSCREARPRHARGLGRGRRPRRLLGAAPARAAARSASAAAAERRAPPAARRRRGGDDGADGLRGLRFDRREARGRPERQRQRGAQENHAQGAPVHEPTGGVQQAAAGGEDGDQAKQNLNGITRKYI